LKSCANINLFLEESLGCYRHKIFFFFSRVEKEIAKNFPIEFIMNEFYLMKDQR